MKERREKNVFLQKVLLCGSAHNSNKRNSNNVFDDNDVDDDDDDNKDNILYIYIYIYSVRPRVHFVLE
jgi:hypothetical protein